MMDRLLMIPGVCASLAIRSSFPLRAWRNLHLYNHPLRWLGGDFNEKRLSPVSGNEDTANECMNEFLIYLVLI